MRVTRLGRVGMYKYALKHIAENDPDFPYKAEDWDELIKARRTPCNNNEESNMQRFCEFMEKVDAWLNKHYDMFELDYTNFEDSGSRDECVLGYTKRESFLDHPDFEHELPKFVAYRA